MEALLETAVRLAAPLLLAALGELIVERSGVVNIGIEGMMLVGAFAAFAVAVATGSPMAGALAGALAGTLLGALFATFSVVRRADQIVVGTALNLLALGGTGLAMRALFAGAVPTAASVREIAVPWLGSLPWLGPVLFRQSLFVYAALALALAAALFPRTRAGLGCARRRDGPRRRRRGRLRRPDASSPCWSARRRRAWPARCSASPTPTSSPRG
jgi:simple sugar transport system permease protein